MEMGIGRVAAVSYCEVEEGGRCGIIWKVLTPAVDGRGL